MSETRILRTAVALSGAVLMSLEILGSRVLAPSYGSSVYVWGSLITTFLAALALGYALGGRIADAYPSPSFLSIILSGAAVLILPSVTWAPKLLEGLARPGWDVRWSSLAAALILFFPPSLAMGMVPPFAVRIAVSRMETVGSVAGGYSALSTAGSIFGTILTAFVLIPSYPVKNLLLGLAGTLALCAVLMMRERRSIVIATAAVFACGMTGFLQGPVSGVGGEKVLLRKDTPYHHIVVTQLDTTRWLRFDNLTQSGVDLARPERAIAGYEDSFFLSFALRPGIRRVCMIGLGGGSFPRSLSRVSGDATIETVEIDPAVREIAAEYFLYEESNRNRTVVQDGRVFLAQDGPAYDLIVLDAFNSTGVPFHLTTREFFETVRRRLTRDGVFAANFIASLMGKDGRLFWASYQTIRRQFGQVYLINSSLSARRKVPTGNVILFATVSADPVSAETIGRHANELAARWKLPQLPGFASALIHSPEPPPGTPELTDAYAPVEALQHF
ncbi:MAG: spermidine synthase [Thermoanaerobaculia bacterium]